MRPRHIGIVVIVAIVVVVAAAVFAIVWRPAIARDASPPSFPAARIEKGAQLAAIGNCITCHTKAGGVAFAGGRPIETPFGTIYSVNITPDRDTGIGGWSEAAFRRAMKDGVSRDGHHLYPAFPYDHMARMRDEDIDAVYAFIMTRRPVRAAAPVNDLSFPFNIRPLVASWKLLFLDRGMTPSDATKGPVWNRGAYLVEGLGHCGACHTPRNALGAEKTDEAYAGGESEGWLAPALNAASPAAVPWDAERLYNYLRHGFDSLHGIAAGPMAPVVRNLDAAPDQDVRAIAVYVADVAHASGAKPSDAEKVLARIKDKGGNANAPKQPGADIYAGACAQCHGELGRTPTNPAVNLALSSTLRMPRPDNAIHIIRDGIRPEHGAGPIMPGFGGVLSDQQLATLLGFLRSYFAERSPWSDVESSIRDTKEMPTKQARSAQ
jgi:mono/diheme cytochrome c family protein